jgi:hypothetical protein
MHSVGRGPIDRLFQKACEVFHVEDDFVPVWRDSYNICALADSERHLGHAVRVGEYWIAYDAIHFNPANDGFRIIGTFGTIEQAKDAIVSSVNLSWLFTSGATDVNRSVKIEEPAGRTRRRLMATAAGK